MNRRRLSGAAPDLRDDCNGCAIPWPFSTDPGFSCVLIRLPPAVVMSLAQWQACGQQALMASWRTPLALALVMSDVGGSTVGQHDVASIDRIVSLPGGRTIALHCEGQGKFTILLEPGDGGTRMHMMPLFAALSTQYRVCAYDRRNIGRSSAAPVPRQAADLAADAFDTLTHAGITGPYILFGTSMGGLLVRSYAASHRVAGFVTSNQPATSCEWIGRAYPAMTASQKAEDAAWMAGNNNEHIDVNDLSRVIDHAKQPSVPHIVMISTEHFQCKAAGLCGPLYRAFLSASRDAARGRRGRLRILDGDHDLYVTNLGDVVAAIHDVASAAVANR